MFDEESFEEFAAAFRGVLIRSHDDGYDSARRVWNAMIDKYPAVIARCTGLADVVSAVNFARENELLVAVRGGGHNVSGNAVCDGGIVIDLSKMKGIHVDPAARTVRAQPGVTWGLFDRETQVFGQATTGGLVSTTGIAGLTLGGGLGWLARKHGTTCDNLVSAEVVTAGGDVVTATASENADLFWGLRGGGGNFGIVTSFEHRLHPVGPLVLAGPIFYPGDSAEEVLRFFREFVAAAPDELTGLALLLEAPPAPFLPEDAHGKFVAALAFCYAGDLDEGERVLRPARDLEPRVADVLGPMPYTALQSMFDGGFPPGLLNYWKSNYVNELPDAAIDTVVSHAREMPSSTSSMYFEHLGGAIDRAGGDETAFGHRGVGFDFSVLASWADPQDSEANIAWTRDLWTAMQPYSTEAVYVNNLGDEGDDRVRSAYAPDRYDRLVTLKDKYDPTNLFRLNQNIRPSVEPAVTAG